MFRLFKLSIHRWLIAIGLGLLVVGAKLWLVDTAGSSMPYRDQIDAEGESILRPWAEDRLEASAFFEPHNEHRVVLTKYISWLGVVLNGQWDVYVQVCLGAILHAGLMLLLLRWIREYLRGWRYALLATLVVTLWVLPLDWENTLGGFQSQVYLVLGLSFLQIWGVLKADRADWRWWGAHACGALALGAMASGVLSSLAVIAVLITKSLREKKVTPLDGFSIGLSGLWIVLGLVGRVSVAGHDVLKADSVGGFVNALTQVTAWPLHGLLPFSLILGFPVLWLAGSILRRDTMDTAQRVILGMIVWMTLTVLATAWLRGNGSPLISRYLTTYYFLIAFQGIALAWSAERTWQKLLFVGWCGVVWAGLWQATSATVDRRLPAIADRMAQSENVIREYLGSGDAAVLQSVPNSLLPYPSSQVLAERWKHASIQALMPAAIRKPLALTFEEPSAATELPAPPYPIIAASPISGQTEPWFWRSERQPDSAMPVLRFRFNGGLGDPETALKLRVVSDASSVEVIPDGPARQRWKTINVMRPSGEWWIEIEDSDTLDRIALTAPVELGWFSWGSEKLIKFHFWWLSAGAIIAVIGLLEALRVRALGLSSRENATGDPSPHA